MDNLVKQDIIEHALEFMQTLVNYQGDFIMTLSTFDIRKQLQCMLEIGVDLSLLKKRVDMSNLEPLDSYVESLRYNYSFIKDLVCNSKLQGHAITSGYGDIIIKDEQNFFMYQDDDHYILVLENRILEYGIDDVLQFFKSVSNSEGTPMNKNLSKRFLQDFGNICLCTIFLDDFPNIPVLFKGRINSTPNVVRLFRNYKKDALSLPKGKQVIAYNSFWERLERLELENSIQD